MKFQLQKTEFEKLVVNRNDKEIESQKFDFQYKIGTSKSDIKIFVIAFVSKLESKYITIESTFVSKFISDSDVDEAFIKGNFAKINAPAIAFPFLRAALANISVLCGHDPIYIPAVNFVELIKNSDIVEEN